MIRASHIAITDKTPTFAKKPIFKDMSEYTFEMVHSKPVKLRGTISFPEITFGS
jgi:hypothetical protein